MKFTVNLPTEIEIKHVSVTFPIRDHEDEDKQDMPLRVGDMFSALIDIDTGKIVDWPKGKGGRRIYEKVVDRGTYSLIGSNGEIIKTLENDYVPHGVIPGEYGDYVDLEVDKFGTIMNWPKNIDIFRNFFAE